MQETQKISVFGMVVAGVLSAAIVSGTFYLQDSRLSALAAVPAPKFQVVADMDFSLRIRTDDRQKLAEMKKSAEEYVRLNRRVVVPLPEWIDSIGNKLTFDEERKEERTKNIALNIFYDAAFAALIGDDVKESARLANFAVLLSQSKNPKDILNEAQAAFGVWVYAPDEKLWRVADFARSEMLKRLQLDSNESIREAIWLLHENLNNVYEQISKGNSSLAGQLFAKYMDELAWLMDRIPAVVETGNVVLGAEEKAMNELMKRYSAFIYPTSISSFLRFNLVLASVTPKAELPVLRDTQISQYIDLIDAVKKDLSVQRENSNSKVEGARMVVMSLKKEISILKGMGGESATAMAVADERLAGLAIFFDFLASVGDAQLHGSFDEELTAFETRRMELAVLEKLVSEQPADLDEEGILSPEELVFSTKADFESQGIEGGEISVSDDGSVNTVKVVGASLSSAKFNAIYRVDKQIFSELVINEESVEQSVSLKNIGQFILAYTGKISYLSGEGGVDQDALTNGVSETSRVERVARLHMVRIFKESGFDVSDTDIEIESLEKAIFSVNRAVWSNDEGENRVASFIWDAVNSALSGVKVETAMGIIEISEVTTLSELKEKSEIIVEKAELDKQRLDEFEKNLKEGISENEVIVPVANQSTPPEERVKVKR